jgi:hypothetical protein
MFDIDIRGGVNEKTRAKIHFPAPRAAIARRAPRVARRLLRATARRVRTIAPAVARTNIDARRQVAHLRRGQGRRRAREHFHRLNAQKNILISRVFCRRSNGPPFCRAARERSRCRAPRLRFAALVRIRSGGLRSARRRARQSSAPRGARRTRRSAVRNCDVARKYFFLCAGSATSPSSTRGACIARRALTGRRAEWTIENSHRPPNCRRRR